MLIRRGERGFTLVELSVAMSLMLLVSGAVLAALDSGTNAEHRASTRIDDEQSVRLVLAQFTRDVRNASTLTVNPLDPLNEVDLGYANGDTVVWSYQTSAHVLQRESNGNAGISLGALTNSTGTVFQLLAPDGSDLFTDQSAGTDDYSVCTATVVASVTSTAHPPTTFTETAHAPFSPPGIDRRGCP